jgi:hypothetical protein
LRLLGEVADDPPSLLVSSRSIGDLGRSRLEAGLLSSSLLPPNRDRWTEAEGGEAAVGEVVVDGDDPAAAAAAVRRCCRRPGLRPNKGPVKPESS